LDERPWYIDFFDDDHLRVFGPLLPDERTADEVNAGVERLGLAPGARLLDLCCRPCWAGPGWSCSRSTATSTAGRWSSTRALS
jgi:hypothetical protein